MSADVYVCAQVQDIFPVPLKKEMTHCQRLPVTHSLHDSDARQMEQKPFVIFLPVINLQVSHVLH